MIAREPPTPLAALPNESAVDSTVESTVRARLRLQSIGWALLAGVSAGLISLPWGLEEAIRSGGCGLFYGLLAFHLQRVDPDDGHLQAGLVGAVCGVRSLSLPLSLDDWRTAALASLVLELLQAWLPLIGSALLLQGLNRFLPASRP
ncbi:MAG: hypothetical protein VXZ59_01665 [Cyanobacteriota bacterium]|nr:hypothetical protein [Cyanobacteriota bacterium]